MIRQPLLTPAQRASVLSFFAALYGFTIAITTYPLWLRPAPAGQLPGYMTALNLDAHASFRFFATVVILTFAAPFALRSTTELLARADTRAWARNGFMASVLAALWYASITRDLPWTLLSSAAAIAVCVLARRIDARFSRRDAILLPTVGTVFIALLDGSELPVQRAFLLAVMVVLAVRIALALFRRATALRPSLCFVLAPLGLILQSHFFARDQRYRAWPVLLLAIVSPFLIRLLIRNTPHARRRLRAAIVLLVYPLAAYGYASATSIVTAETRPRVDFFEEGQHLAPGNEVFRGEKPYRDIVPPHGLIQDALLDAALLRHGPVRIGTVLKARGTLSGVASIAGYAIAAGATGSADVAMFSVFGAALLGFSTGNVRFLPSLITLATAIFALRRRSRPLLAAAAAVAVVAVLTSVDFGAYAAMTVVIAALMFGRGRRLRALATAAVAAAAAFAVAAIPMLLGGYFLDFIRVTLFEVLTLGPVYALMPFTPPKGFDRPFPEMLTSLFEPYAPLFFAWIATLLVLAATAVRGIRSRGLRRRQVEATVLIAAWVVIVGISYAERHHLYFHFAVMPLMTAVIWLLLRARNTASRLLGASMIALVIVLGAITSHLSVVSILRHTRAPMDPDWREVGLPRAQGALFLDRDIRVIDSVNRYANAHLHGPDDTFFDFTNNALLYFLLDRNIPVRQIEPAFYETEERQREVVGMLASNPWVKFAIVPIAPKLGIDTVGNEKRAPLVWKYLQENFEPDFAEGSVEIWKRKG